MHVPQSFQENVCNKWIFGVVMEGGEGVALFIILCRLTDDLENHMVDQAVSWGACVFTSSQFAWLNCGMSWEPKDEMMTAQMCMGWYLHTLKAASSLKSSINSSFITQQNSSSSISDK